MNRAWVSPAVPAHFRSTPDLRNDDKFQISRPRVPVLVHLPLYIRSTRAIEGRVRVLHLRFYLKPVETCPPPLSPSLGLSRDSTPNLGEKETRV